MTLHEVAVSEDALIGTAGGGVEDQALGQGFLQRAATVLRRGGALWLTANRHLPYETVLKPLFSRVETRAEARGFKVIEAHK